MKKVVVKVTCDRCGKEETFDNVKNNDDLYLRMHKHGWENVHGLNICGDCSEEFDKLYDIFMKKTVDPVHNEMLEHRLIDYLDEGVEPPKELVQEYIE